MSVVVAVCAHGCVCVQANDSIIAAGSDNHVHVFDRTSYEFMYSLSAGQNLYHVSIADDIGCSGFGGRGVWLATGVAQGSLVRLWMSCSCLVLCIHIMGNVGVVWMLHSAAMLL